MKLVIATTNPGKLHEIVGILGGATLADGTSIELIPLSSLPPIAEPEETGETFAENARLKALYYARTTGVASAADDSGFEVVALDDAPGVHSARWHGTDYDVKFRKIYELLRERGVQGSRARFVCHVAVADASGVVLEAHGTVDGEIAAEPRGTNGFGYDPIFYYPPFRCTLAELDQVRKASVSHRGQAFSALRQALQTLPWPPSVQGTRGKTP
jgi:XTP/dITP diphosphohydrolase